ncbi:hypothetical protein AB0M00_01330 [Streptomyces chartreusis]|uniref:hypothetical protein n=1 Tax=Streptomyces chartreusis TaxID=1969 RepID=UPI00341625D4
MAETWLNHGEADLSRPVHRASGRSTHRPARVLPYFGSRSLDSLRPVHIREWLRKLQDGGVAPAYQRVIFANFNAILGAAVDDGLIPENPCRSSPVKGPKLEPRRGYVGMSFAVRSAMLERFRGTVDLVGGCSMRHGEVLGLGGRRGLPLRGWFASSVR